MHRVTHRQCFREAVVLFLVTCADVQRCCDAASKERWVERAPPLKHVSIDANDVLSRGCCWVALWPHGVFFRQSTSSLHRGSANQDAVCRIRRHMFCSIIQRTDMLQALSLLDAWYSVEVKRPLPLLLVHGWEGV